MGRKVVDRGDPSTQGIVPFIQNGWTVAAAWGSGGAALTQSNPSPGADTYETLLTVTGSGWLDFLGVLSNSATSRTITVLIEIDGVAAFTSVSGTVTTASQGRALLGASTAVTDYAANMQPLRFNTSLVVKMKDSVGVDAGQSLYYAVRTE